MASLFKNLQIRRGTAADFKATDPILKAGEPAISLDTGELKIGDGISKWSDLAYFSSVLVKTAIVNIPSIQANTSHTLKIPIDSISLDHEYAIVTAPDSILPDYIDIRYSYASDTDEVSVVLTNIDNSVVDGNANGNASVATNNVKLHILCYITDVVTVTTTTTTTPDPIVDDVFSFGYNEFGQLGLKDKANRNIPTFIYDNNTKWTQFAAGNYHTLAIDSENNIHSVGYNYYGQLGLGNSGGGANRLSLEKVSKSYFKDGSVYSNNPQWRYISAGSYHSLAVDVSGNLFTCGDGSYGALGLGNQVGVDNFTLVGEQYYFIDLDRLTENSTDGSCFTLNEISDPKYKFITNGNGEYIISGIPVNNPVAVSIPYANGVSGGGLDGKWYKDDKQLLAYSGENLETFVSTKAYFSGHVTIDVSGDYGAISLHSLNDNMCNYNEIIHFQSPNASWEDISAGNHHSLGVKNSGLYAWGHNSYGQVGTGNHEDVLIPTLVGGSKYYSQVAAGKNHSLALDSDGTVHSFGNNLYGQLGIGNASHKDTPTPILFDFSQISDSNFTNLPTDANWNNGDGIYFTPPLATETSYNPIERYVLEEGTYIIRNVPSTHPIAILNGGVEDKITYSGDNNAGCLSVNQTTSDGKYNFYWGDVYITVTGDFEKVSIYCANHGYMGGKNLFFYATPSYNPENISAGTNHTVIRTDTDQVLTFGRNNYGQLGTGDNQDRNVPFRVSEDNIKYIDAGGDHTLFVDSSKYIWSFGDNQHGELGLADNIARSTPERLNNSIRWKNVYAGGSHSFATVFAFYPNVPSNFKVQNADDSNLVGNRQLMLSWNHVTAYDEAITHYVIEYSADNGNSWVVYDNEALAYKFYTDSFLGATREDTQSTTFSYIIDSLDNTYNYLVRIAGVNATGTGQYTTSSQPVSPKEAVDLDFANVLLYSHLDNGNIADISNYTWPHTAYFNTNATRYLDGNFGEALRLYEYDGIKYDANLHLDGEFTIEFFINPRNYAADTSSSRSNPIITLKKNSEEFLRMAYNGSDASTYTFSLYKQDETTSLASVPLTEINQKKVEGFAHIAITRTSGAPDNPASVEVVRLFYNGLLIDSGRDVTEYDINNILLGSGMDSFYDFDIDEFRITSGVRYDHEQSFNPTTKPFGI